MIDLEKIQLNKYEEVKNDSIIKNARILIIDDSENNIKVLGNLLRKYNCEVLMSLEPVKGLKIAEQKIPDIILLDVLMPEMDGFEVYEELKKNSVTKSIPVIFITSVNNSKNIVKGFELGAVDYIIKPFNHDEVIARIKSQLKFQFFNSHLGALFNSKHHTFITLNEKYEIVNFNNTANEREYLFTHEGYKIGDNILKHTHQNDRAFILNKINTALRGRIVDFERSYFVDNVKKWFSYVIEPIRGVDNVIIGCIINGSDVTIKKEQEIKEANYHKKINDMYLETQQSLSYASYIQNAIFPKINVLEDFFDDSFILFKPKEKISGDFYWTYNLENQYLIVLGDCTGHGVPGALLTTVSIVLLERIVKYQKIYSPEKILDELNNNIIQMLNQQNGGIKDGLEMAVCLFDKKSRLIEFSGAKRSIFVSKNEKLIEIKGDRMEIGGGEEKRFNKHHIYPESGSVVYIYSDGVTDQIGGEKNKKFMKKELSKLIISLNHKKMNIQQSFFETTINDWIGNEEQTDDILLIGVRV